MAELFIAHKLAGGHRLSETVHHGEVFIFLDGTFTA